MILGFLAALFTLFEVTDATREEAIVFVTELFSLALMTFGIIVIAANFPPLRPLLEKITILGGK